MKKSKSIKRTRDKRNRNNRKRTEEQNPGLQKLRQGRVTVNPIRANTGLRVPTEDTRAGKRTGIALAALLLVLTLGWCLIRPGKIRTEELVISEVLPANTCAVTDENGMFRDCIEIMNVSDKTVNLKGLGLTDRDSRIARYVIGDETLAPGEVRLFFCESELPFSLKKGGGETVCLLDTLGNTLSQVTTFRVEDNRSIAWNGSAYVDTDEITPGFPNTEAGRAAYLATRFSDETAPVITEAARNITLEENGRFLIEVGNCSDAVLSLAGYGISDDPDDLFRFTLPEEELAPGAVRVFSFGDGASDGEFSFSAEEKIYLCDPLGRILSEVPVPEAGDSSVSLQEDGSYAADALSVGFANTAEGIDAFREAHPMNALRISEVVTGSDSVLNGNDYIELVNDGAKTVDLSAYSLALDDPQGRCAALSGSLSSGERVVLAANEEESGKGILPLSLSRGGVELYLLHHGAVADYLWVPALSCDEAYGRTGAGREAARLSEATPGEENGTVAQPVCGTPAADHPGGVYEDVDCVTVTLTGAGDIYYTLDCTEPTEEDLRYTEPIVLEKTGVIRARCFSEDCDPGEIFTATYIINEGHTLDVACLVSEPEGLFSQKTGIYATGYGENRSLFTYRENYWQGWEREATVSLYAEDGGFTAPCGIRIFGNFTRFYAKKPFAVYFRSCYGVSELNYPLFGKGDAESYESFILRAAGQDGKGALMRDALAARIVQDLVDPDMMQDARPVVLYLNGEYWGIYYIREKQNEDYVANHFNVEGDSVRFCELMDYSGNYGDIVRYVRTHNMNKPENYAYLQTQVDLESYVKFLAVESCIGNYDRWNSRWFSSDQFDGGRWHWVIHDVDYAFTASGLDGYEIWGKSLYSPVAGYYSAHIAEALHDNPDFRCLLMTEMAREVNEVWTEENINAYVDAFCAVLEPEMERECERWDWSVSTWESNVQSIRDFAGTIRENVTGSMRKHFYMTDAELKEYGF